MSLHSVSIKRLLAIAASMLTAFAPAYAQSCGLCNTAVVINADLANCFLSEFAALAAKGGEAVVVDLSDCETSRGIAEALPSPLTVQSATAIEPDLQFMVSRKQLDCLKQKLEQPGLVLDPFVRIELAGCG